MLSSPSYFRENKTEFIDDDSQEIAGYKSPTQRPAFGARASVISAERLELPTTPSRTVNHGSSRECNSLEERKPYNPVEESFPTHKFYKEPFQQALKDSKSLANQIGTILCSHKTVPAITDDLSRLVQDAQKLGNFIPRSTRTVAVLGDSGDGELIE